MTTPSTTSRGGFLLTASSCPVHGVLLAADLVVQKPGHAPHSFPALDYFFDHEQAVNYATRWGASGWIRQFEHCIWRKLLIAKALTFEQRTGSVHWLVRTHGFVVALRASL
jgi:hypothetical protein